jgi:ATP-dependent Clp protease ATP-binding subunit ClpC
VAPTHVLVALFVEGYGVAAQVLRNLEVSEDAISEAIRILVRDDGTRAANHNRLFSPEAEDLVRDAVDEAFALRHNYVGTEHLMLALTRDVQVTVAQVFSLLKLRPRDIRDEVLGILGHLT